MKAPLAFLLWLTLQLGGSDAQIYAQQLSPSENYYIYNPEYPNNYYREESSLWSMESEYKIQLNCTLHMPLTTNCNGDYITVGVDSKTKHKYCGDGTFTLTSKGNSLTVEFKSSSRTPGGKFLCVAKALVGPELDQNCRCGWKNPSRIVGGTETGVNEYPMMCALVDLTTSRPYCGCTIIEKTYVLSAAHCFGRRNITNIGVLVGDHDYTTGSDTDASRLYGIRNVTIHPNYVESLNINDIAIIRIKGVIQFNQKVGPACLPIQHSPDTFGGDHVTALGWGATEFGGETATALQKVVMSVLTNLQCKKNYDQVTVNQLCTYAEDKDTCSMDSGGPILWENPTTHNIVLVGVINYGIGCAVLGGVNARVGAYVDWILEETPDTTYCMIE